MKRLLTLTGTLLVTLSSFAFNFIGKTFRGTNELDEPMSITFTTSEKAKVYLKLKGQKAESGTIYWEVSGDYINLYDPQSGLFFMALGIDEDDYNNIALVGYDHNGRPTIYLEQVKSAPSSKSSSKKSSSKKRR